ncbi:hypothetical protein BHE74_00044271 [Ensete ventricosum]|nr:hypothetical protein GW17_00017224 [Ensete ventricosum]RWW49549.1 hypothetical protein BHE74_00044271 [Ensete ventricosum]RZR83421.1 hypothetical protein BHM03_00010022 [Ensete ventricosum]
MDGRQRLARKRLPTTHPQGVAASGAPAKGCRQHWRRPQGWLPLGKAAVGRNAQCRRMRRGSDGDGGVGG